MQEQLNICYSSNTQHTVNGGRLWFMFVLRLTQTGQVFQPLYEHIHSPLQDVSRNSHNSLFDKCEDGLLQLV